MSDDILARVLYRDTSFIVLNKPAGLPVHPGPGGGVCIEHFFPLLTFGLPRPPALAHRLDRDTSGCLILGRHRKTLAKLGKLFQQGRIGKTYWAIVEGTPPGESGTIDAPLAKLTPKQGWKMVVDPQHGQHAVSDWKLLGRGELPGIGPISWIEFSPKTGRTHQIRVHALHLGCPVLGDPVYGPPKPALPLHLHAQKVVIPFKSESPPVEVTAPPPDHMLTALKLCGWTA
jgi:RluA family pseudouridine synthase